VSPSERRDLRVIDAALDAWFGERGIRAGIKGDVERDAMEAALNAADEKRRELAQALPEGQEYAYRVAWDVGRCEGRTAQGRIGLRSLGRACSPRNLGASGAMSRRIASIACCPKHGLHGERTECFVCGDPVEQVPMVEFGWNETPEPPFDAAELVRWAEMYGHPEEWAKLAQAAHARAESAEAELERIIGGSA
jgi:hypothetical protein